MSTTIKAYVVIENFEKDYSFLDGYVNSIYLSKEDAIKTCEILTKGNEDVDYTVRIIEKEIFIGENSINSIINERR